MQRSNLGTLRLCSWREITGIWNTCVPRGRAARRSPFPDLRLAAPIVPIQVKLFSPDQTQFWPFVFGC